MGKMAEQVRYSVTKSAVVLPESKNKRLVQSGKGFRSLTCFFKPINDFLSTVYAQTRNWKVDATAHCFAQSLPEVIRYGARCRTFTCG